MLCDRIVCGIKEVRIQQRLLSEKTVTLEQTYHSYLMESTATYSKSRADHQTLNCTTDKISKISKVQPKTFEKNVINAAVQNTQLKTVLSKKQNVFTAT